MENFCYDRNSIVVFEIVVVAVHHDEEFCSLSHTLNVTTFLCSLFCAPLYILSVFSSFSNSI